MIPEVQTICFVGAGTMGSYNSIVSALAGYQAYLYDISEETLELSIARQQEWGEFFIEKGAFNKSDIRSALDRITRTTHPEEAAKNADLLSESVFEQLPLKRETHAKFESLLPKHAIMTTNTSTILLSKIESAVKRGDKFAAMHFHQPTPLVDIVAGPRTTHQTLDLVQRFVKSQAQYPIVLKKEKDGYLHNTMFGAILRAGSMLSAIFKVDFREIDRAWMIDQGSVVGPFGMMDFVGLNVITDSIEEAKERNEAIGAEISGAVRNFFKPYLENNHLGRKTGRGFYNYPEPEFQQPEFLMEREENKDLSKTLRNALLLAALGLVAGEHADFEDVDRSWMLTHNPKIGPFGMIDKLGLDRVKQELEEQAELSEALLGNPGIIREETEAALSCLKPYVERGELGEIAGKGFYSYPEPEFSQPDFLSIKPLATFARPLQE